MIVFGVPQYQHCKYISCNEKQKKYLIEKYILKWTDHMGVCFCALVSVLTVCVYVCIYVCAWMHVCVSLWDYV